MKLTKEEVKQITRHELNALIAKCVFGLNVTEMDWPCGYDYESGVPEASGENPSDFPTMYNERWPVFVPEGVDPAMEYSRRAVPMYSTSLLDAWQVVEHLKQQGFHFNLHDMEDYKKGNYSATFRRFDPYKVAFEGMSISEGPALAICRAALLAIAV